jgi:hypothetical protein
MNMPATSPLWQRYLAIVPVIVSATVSLDLDDGRHFPARPPFDSARPQFEQPVPEPFGVFAIDPVIVEEVLKELLVAGLSPAVIEDDGLVSLGDRFISGCGEECLKRLKAHRGLGGTDGMPRHLIEVDELLGAQQGINGILHGWRKRSTPRRNAVTS